MSWKERAVGDPLHGQWWARDTPDCVIGGQLRLQRDIWKLTAYGALGTWTNRHLEIPGCVHGLADATDISLLNTVPAGWRTRGGSPPYESQLSANLVIAGRLVDETTRFSRAIVRFLHLDEWGNRSPWTTKLGPEHGPYEHSITFIEPEILTAGVPGATVELLRSWRSRDHRLSSVTMESHEEFHLRFDTPQDVETIQHDFVRPLQRLIEVAALAWSPVLDLRLAVTGDETFTPMAEVLSAVEPDPAPPQESFRLLFHLDDFDFAAFLPRWWKLHQRVDITADLLAELWGNRYGAPQFLTAASAIEAYHTHTAGRTKPSESHRQRLAEIYAAIPDGHRAWLKERLARSHEPSFADRIEDVLRGVHPQYLDAIGDATAWRKWVKDARNSIAHRAPGMKDTEKEWRTMVWVTASIRWLLALLLVDAAGVPSDVVERGIRNNEGLDRLREQLAIVEPTWFGASGEM